MVLFMQSDLSRGWKNIFDFSRLYVVGNNYILASLCADYIATNMLLNGHADEREQVLQAQSTLVEYSMTCKLQSASSIK